MRSLEKGVIDMLKRNFAPYAVFLVVAASFGCGKKAVERIQPVEITEKTECALDGMLLSEYSGPKAQIHYRGNKGPDFFCETEELFKVYLQPGIKAEVTAIYVQDTAAIDWAKPFDSWIDGKTAFFVVGSRREGAMGQTYAPFNSREAAASFIKEYGGELMTFAQLAEKVEKDLGK